MTALEMALQRRPAPGLVHHSDQGVQYASHEYVALLEAHEVRISMSRRGNPWDNASCESFMKTLKCEEVYRSEYRNLAEARARIGEFLEEIYHQKRLHSSLGYCPPAEFERLQSSRPMLVAAVTQEARSFLRHGEIYPCDEGAISRPRPLIAVDESPAGYSWQVALQQSPLPLHQPELYCPSSTSPDNASAANGEM